LFPLLSWPDAGPALCYPGRDCENAAAGGIGRGATPNDLKFANTGAKNILPKMRAEMVVLPFLSKSKRRMQHSSEKETMTISDAQRDVRTIFRGGFAGQLVSSSIWFASASLATWYSTKDGIVMLIVGGFFIFPLTQLLLRAMGGPSSLPKGHPMTALGMQIAFIVPFNLPLVGAAAIHHLSW